LSTGDPRELPDWAKDAAHRAVRFVVHASDPLYRAEQRRVPGQQAARRRIAARVQALGAAARQLSSIDQQNLDRALAPLRALLAEWTAAAERPALRRPRGRAAPASPRWGIFREIASRLVNDDGWPLSVAREALAQFVVSAYPPVDGAGERRNTRLYGALSPGYGHVRPSRSRRSTRQRVAAWEARTPIAERARLAFLQKLSTARLPQSRNE
jgi:hypothetical protein